MCFTAGMCPLRPTDCPAPTLCIPQVKQVDLGAKVISCAAYCAKNAGKATACKWVEGTCPSGKSTICSTVF